MAGTFSAGLLIEFMQLRKLRLVDRPQLVYAVHP